MKNGKQQRRRWQEIQKNCYQNIIFTLFILFFNFFHFSISLLRWTSPSIFYTKICYWNFFAKSFLPKFFVFSLLNCVPIFSSYDIIIFFLQIILFSRSKILWSVLEVGALRFIVLTSVLPNSTETERLSTISLFEKDP